MKIFILLLQILTISCGKIKIETQKVESDPVKFGPDFEKAIAICDDRYGVKTKESEECFQDYRTFLSPKVQLDLGSVDTFCKDRYSTETDVSGCKDDLLNIINKASESVK